MNIFICLLAVTLIGIATYIIADQDMPYRQRVNPFALRYLHSELKKASLKASLKASQYQEDLCKELHQVTEKKPRIFRHSLAIRNVVGHLSVSKKKVAPEQPKSIQRRISYSELVKRATQNSIAGEELQSGGSETAGLENRKRS